MALGQVMRATACCKFKLRDIQLVQGSSLALVMSLPAPIEPGSTRSPRQAARETLRSLLARSMSCPPESLRFAQSASGKPYLVGRDAPAFNLSHSRGFSLIALSTAGEIGCDIEDRFTDEDASDLWPLILHPQELEAMDGLATQDRLEAFRRYWVRKEAVLKAVGSGFLEDPRRLIVGLHERHARWASQEGPPFVVHNQLIDIGYPAAVASMDPSCAWYLLDD